MSALATAACGSGAEIAPKPGEAAYDVCLESHLSADAGTRRTGSECEEPRGATPVAPE
jgi:hypothetical protein